MNKFYYANWNFYTALVLGLFFQNTRRSKKHTPQKETGVCLVKQPINKRSLSIVTVVVHDKKNTSVMNRGIFLFNPNSTQPWKQPERFYQFVRFPKHREFVHAAR